MDVIVEVREQLCPSKQRYSRLVALLFPDVPV